MVEIVGHSQTKGRGNREPKLRPKPARQSSTLLMSGDGKRGDGPQATAPIPDSTTTNIATCSMPETCAQAQQPRYTLRRPMCAAQWVRRRSSSFRDLALHHQKVTLFVLALEK
jgi:hypothetical protein